MQFEEINFKDIDYVFVTDYIHYLRMRGISENSIHMYLSNFRAVYNKARKQGIRVCGENPFAGLNVRRQETVKRALSKEEIALIASADLRRYPQLEAARDLFMFSFYCRGMSFVDVIHLKHDGIVRDTIFYTRSKTGQRLQIGLLPAMKEIIENTGHPARTFFLISTGSHREMPTRNTATLWARSTVTSNAWAHCST